MSVPGVVESTLGDESVAAEVPLGGEDVLYITPTRTMIYRAEGLLSDESVEEYPHDAERLTLKEGRRKTRFSLEYPLEGTKEFTIPSNRTEQAVHPVLAGIMNASGVTDTGETVVKTYRFSEMTLAITSERLVKHVGEVVWDEDYEEYHYADVTGLTFEEGSVATQIVLEVDGRQQRIKAPKEHAREVRERLTQALCSYYDVTSMDALLAAVAPDEDVEEEPAEETGSDVFGEGVDPLDANPPVPDDETGARGDAESAPTNDAAGGGAAGDADTGAPAADTTQQPAGGAGQRETADASASAAGNASQEERSSATQQEQTSEPRRESSGDDHQERTNETQEDPLGTTDTPQNAAAGSSAQSEQGAAADDEQPSEETSDAGSGFEFEQAGFEPAGTDAESDVAAELAELRKVVEQQNERLDKQRHAIERLVEELSRGR